MHLIPEAIPILQDNYIWLLRQGANAIVVDPGQYQPVADYLQQHQLTLRAILVTHQHPDHIGGLAELSAAWPDAGVFVPVASTTDKQLAGRQVEDGDLLNIAGWQGSVTVLSVPGHTLNHLAYLVDCTPQVLFCGDTLFSAGCGRLFEGSPAQMLQSLQRLAALPESTLVCCAHEYTLANLRFALEVEPENQALVEYQRHASTLRSDGVPTLPSQIGLERSVNPFLRCNELLLQQRWSQPDALSLFTFLRQWKNRF